VASGRETCQDLVKPESRIPTAKTLELPGRFLWQIAGFRMVVH
jgi:hypothetical protein